MPTPLGSHASSDNVHFLRVCGELATVDANRSLGSHNWVKLCFCMQIARAAEMLLVVVNSNGTVTSTSSGCQCASEQHWHTVQINAACKRMRISPSLSLIAIL